MPAEDDRVSPDKAKMKDVEHRQTPTQRDNTLIAQREITDPFLMIEAMARDIHAARREGITGLVDLTEYGWTPAQVIRHAASAHARANAPAFQLHHLGGVA